MKSFRVIIVALLVSIMPLQAKIRLPKLISDGMVLQRDANVNVWGWADANEVVTVSIEGKSYKTKADAAGNWKVVLKKHQAGGPYDMVITASNSIEIKNIVFGDVWLCSGQSNMELPMRRVKPLYEVEIATANNPFIRTFIVPQKYNFKKAEPDYLTGSWQEVNPQTIQNFSAVAYFFAADLYAKYKIPIGIINASLGGSPAEAWMSEEALKSFPDYLQEAYKWRNDQLIKSTDSADMQLSNRWYAEANSKDAGHAFPHWSASVLDDSDWQTMEVPGYWSDKYPKIKNGVVWFRREFNVSKTDTDKQAFLNLGRIVDADSVFINGKCVGNVTYQYPPRWYNVPAGVLLEGRNVITVRVVSNAGRGGFVLDKPYELTVGATKIDLKGNWKLKQGCEMPVLPGQTFIRWKPMGLYNAMIAPLNNYTKAGIVWYQGEANTSKPDEYTKLLSAMLADWRKKFNQQNLPFLLAQLPNFMEAKPEPTESNWAKLRVAQLNMLSVKNTGVAVTIDAGEWNDIHPLNKKTVGVRLAKLADKMHYGVKINAAAPRVKSARIVNNTIEISFDRAGNCLITKDGQTPQEFAIAGADGKFMWAKAEILGNKVIVSCSKVLKPIRVRYAWADNPSKANLTDVDGNFVSPFQCIVGK